MTMENLMIKTYCPREVCNSNVTSVDVPGQRQLLANNAYLNSSSHTTCSGYKSISIGYIFIHFFYLQMPHEFYSLAEIFEYIVEHSEQNP